MDYIAGQDPLSLGFPRQEYWSGLPFPSLGDLPDPGIEPAPPVLAGGFFTTEPPGKPIFFFFQIQDFSCLLIKYVIIMILGKKLKNVQPSS